MFLHTDTGEKGKFGIYKTIPLQHDQHESFQTPLIPAQEFTLP